jgi:hypothetical protein
VNPTVITADGSARCVFDKADEAHGWVLDLDGDSDGSLRFNSIHSLTTKASRSSFGGAVPANTWTRVAATWDGGSLASGIHLYANGSELATDPVDDNNAADAKPPDAIAPASINCNANTSMPGALDDIQIYDRVLSAAEIGGL